jgi:group II intron reverse transcriptase/maturase
LRCQSYALSQSNSVTHPSFPVRDSLLFDESLMREWLQTKALRAAFSRVRENHGCAGTDGVTIAGFESHLDGHLAALREEVESETYWAWPLRLVEVEKKPGSEERRTLLVPAVRDRVLQTAVARWMEPYLEKEFNDCSFGYRRGRGVRMAVDRVLELQKKGYRWVVDADIDAFFDSVDRRIALSRLAAVVQDDLAIRLNALWIDHAIWDGLHLKRPALGIPQGAVVSPMIANLVLDRLDDRLEGSGLVMVRYADDFVVLAKGKGAAEQALELVTETLEELRLRLHAGKTRVVRYRDGFRFLGVIFLKDWLLQPWKPAAKGARPTTRIIRFAGDLPDVFFPDSERRRLRKYVAH